MATQSDFRVKKGLIVGTTDTANPESGTFTYDADFETVDLTLDANVNARLAQDHYFYVKAGATITKGDVVYASGAVGNSGKIEASPYIANNTIDESLVLGVAAEDIATGAFGYVAQFGSIRGLDASGGLTTGGESWSDGVILYASPTYAGELTITKPSAPNQDIPIAFVISNNASTGTIAVRASRLGYHMDEVHDVEITSVADKDLLVYNTSNSRWENGKTIGDLNAANVTLTGELNGPATFYIDPAPHDPDTDGSTNGLVVIRGDLQVDGTTTTINSTIVSVDDKNIILADGASNNTEASGGGITIAGSSAQLTYDGVQDRWNMNKGLELLSVPLVVGTGSTDVGRIENVAGVFSMTAYTGRQIAFGNDTSGEHVRIDENGRVGVGNNDPFARVHSEINAASGAGAGTSGALWLRNRNQTDGNAATIFWGDDEAAAMGAINLMHDSYSNNYGSIDIDTRGTSGYNTKLTITSSGDVIAKNTGLDTYVHRSITNAGSGSATRYIVINKTNIGAGFKFVGRITGSRGTGVSASNWAILDVGFDVNSSGQYPKFGVNYQSGYHADLYLDMTAQWVTIDWDDGNGSATWWALQLSSNSSSNWPADLDNMAFSGYVHNVANNSGEIIVIEDATETISNITPLGRGQTTVFNHSHVGIGTTSPLDKLHVSTSDSNLHSTTLTKGTNTKGLWLTNSNNDDDMMGVHMASGGGTHFASIMGARTNNAAHWGTHLGFYTHDDNTSNLNTATEKVRITGNGNVGIGTASPSASYKLDVSGLIAARGGARAIAFDNLESTGRYGIGFGAYDGLAVTQMFANSGYGSSAVGLGFDNNGTITPALLVRNGGNVGIGTASPNSNLHIKSTSDVKLTLETDEDSDCWINLSGATSEASIGYEPATNSLRFANAADGVTSNVRMTIDASGNVGIGISDPEYKLDVAGGYRSHMLSTSGEGGHAVQDGVVETKGHSFALGGGGSVLISDATVSASNQWTVIFKGHWANNYEGGGLIQSPPITVVSDGYPRVDVGSTDVVVDIDPGTNRLRASNQNGAYAVHFTGTIEVLISAQGSMSLSAPIKTNGIQLKPNQNMGGSGGGHPFGSYANGLILDTPLYKEYQYYWSGTNRTHTTTLTCGSYFMAEVVYVSNQTNSGGNSEGIQRYIRGKWANNYTSHNWVPFEDSGNTSAVSLSISATDNSAADSYGNAGPYSGRLTINEVVGSGSYAGTRLLVRVWYAGHNIYHDES